MNPTTRRKWTFLAGFSAYFLALWFLWETPLIYPLKIFVVLLHELSHGVAAVATGGTIEQIALTPDQGGACLCPGGNAFLTLSAGYLGSLTWGALILTLARRGEGVARWVTAAIGAAVVIATLAYVRTAFGIGFGVTFGAALIVTANWLPRLCGPLLTALGLTSCLYAILDIKSDVLDRPGLESDARMLAELTGVPTLVWGALWIAIAIGISALLFRRAFRDA